MNDYDYSSLLEPLHSRLRSLHYSRSKARDELFLLLHFYGPCQRQTLLTKARMSRDPLYRNLRLFLKIEAAQEVKPGLFELTDRFKQHHHYMWCRICHQSITFYDESLEKALMKSFERKGFALEHHELSISGICPRCLGNPKNRPQPAIGTRLRRYILQT